MSERLSEVSILNPSFLRDVDYALRAFDDVKETVVHTLKSFPIGEIIEAKIDAVKQIEWAQRPAVYIEPMLFAEAATASSIVVTLCLDTKQHELYEYDNYRHCMTFSKKADQQFRILRKVSEAEGSYIQTADLMKIGEYKSIDATYKAIEKINQKANSIGLLDRLVVGSQGDGYRLNPDYRVSIV